MKLEDIGFYTLSDERAKNTSSSSDLWRCELILTTRCNFSCPYCRGLKPAFQGNLPFEEASKILGLWIDQNLHNVRFSGGEPTLYARLPDLVAQAKNGGVDRIAVSTNGSASIELYEWLLRCGVNDFSISLDGCCSKIGDIMAGNISGVWEHVVEVIKYLSTKTYVTTGMVFTESNIDQALDSVLFAHNLGVADIRVIPSAQYNLALEQLSRLPKEILDAHPILAYRVNNIKRQDHVRGLQAGDCGTCNLALDDMVSAAGYHFPCVIHMREGGNPIGKLDENVREQRKYWVEKHNSWEDPICVNNCLDICRFYNNVSYKGTGTKNETKNNAD